MRRALLIPVWLCALVAGRSDAVEVAVVNPSVPETTLSAERVRDILLGRVTTWQDGSAVVIILIEDPQADAALLQVAGRDSTRLLRGWKRLVYAGTGAMPLVVHGLTEGLAAVAEHPGGIAVVPLEMPGNRWRCLRLLAKDGP
jgi:hypothetical protein